MKLEKKNPKRKRAATKGPTNTQGATTGLSAGEKLLSPSIEYYKNVAKSYKKTLAGLQMNQPGY